MESYDDSKKAENKGPGLLGSFLSPYAFGAAKDATGGYQAGLIGSSVVASMLAAYLIYLRAHHGQSPHPRAGAGVVITG